MSLKTLELGQHGQIPTESITLEDIKPHLSAKIIAPKEIFGYLVAALAGIGLSCGGIMMLIGAIQAPSADNSSSNDICTTHPLTVQTPVGTVVVGEEGKQDMRDPFKKKIVSALEMLGISKVEC